MLEALVLPALARGGYAHARQVHIGTRLGGRGRHLVDVLTTDAAGRRVLVSLTWQQVSGTAEQQVPFEALCLAEAVRTSAGTYAAASLVLGGPGWTLRDFFTGSGLEEHLRFGQLVTIVSLETCIARANAGRL